MFSDRHAAIIALLALPFTCASQPAEDWQVWKESAPDGAGAWVWKSGEESTRMTAEKIGEGIFRVTIGAAPGGPDIPAQAEVVPSGVRVENLPPILFLRREGQVRCLIPAREKERFFGLGEKYNTVDQAGRTASMWVDSGYRSLGDLTYLPVPMYISSAGYGLLLGETTRSVFQPNAKVPDDFLGGHVSSVTVAGETMTLTLWTGDDYAELHRRYCEITGFPEAPPEWAFGVWLSRASYSTQAEVLEVAERWRALELPLSVFNIEGWHGKPWHSFAQDRFPDPRGMIEKLHEYGCKVMLWNTHNLPPDDPNYKHGDEKGYFAKGLDGKTYNIPAGYGRGGCIDVTNPEAMRWWNSLYDPLMELGVDALFNDITNYLDDDMSKQRAGQMRFSNGKTTEEMHNLYWLLFNKATYEYLKEKTGDDTVVRSAGGWAGQQKYSSVWAGDSATTWEFLERDIKALLSSGWSGVPYFGYDIPGFSEQGNPPSPELYIRWVQFGALSPMMQFHTTARPEPWHYGDEAIANLRSYGWLRESLMPHIYSLALEAEATGAPMARSLAWHYLDDETAGAVEDEFLLGSHLLVAPLCRPGHQRRIYLPEGRWMDIADGSAFEGPIWTEAQAPLTHLPIYLREGGILPVRLDPALRVAAPLYDGHIAAVEILPPARSGTGAYTWRRDNGETRITCRRRKSEIIVRARGDELPAGTLLRVECGPPTEVQVDGDKVEELSLNDIAAREKAGYHYNKSEQACFVHPGPGESEISITEKHGHLIFEDWLAPVGIATNLGRARFEVTMALLEKDTVPFLNYKYRGGSGAIVGASLGDDRWRFDVPLEPSSSAEDIAWSVLAQARTGQAIESRERISVAHPPVTVSCTARIKLGETGAFDVRVRSLSSAPTRGVLSIEAPEGVKLAPASISYSVAGMENTREYKVRYRISPADLPSLGPGEHPIRIRHRIGATDMQTIGVIALKPFDWQVVGPFQSETAKAEWKKAFETKWSPEAGEVDLQASYESPGGEVKWRPFPSEAIAADGMMDLEQVFGKVDNVSAYLTTTLSSETERKVWFRAGSDDAVMIWLNGELLLNAPALRPAARDQEAVEVTLKKGANRVLVKVFDLTDAWRLYFRIADARGRPVTDLTN